VVRVGVVYVVEPRKGNVLGNADAAFVQSAEQSHGNEVFEREHPGGPAGQHLVHRFMAGLGAGAALEHPEFDAGMCGPELVQPCHACPVGGASGGTLPLSAAAAHPAFAKDG
jgi:hypothetical protein